MREKSQSFANFADVVENLPTMSASRIKARLTNFISFANAPQNHAQGARRTRTRAAGGIDGQAEPMSHLSGRRRHDRLVDRYSVISWR